ncbi:MAG: hypothetical protein BWK77_00425 [Verrucomicrobia bacterium A1]|nr:MAG: hypothetical protein BWK77_00425 [Verrucomicrobia bacterium A1]
MSHDVSSDERAAAPPEPGIFCTTRWSVVLTARDGTAATRGGVARFAAEPRDVRTPEQEFDRQWALRLLDEVLRRLEAEYAAAGQRELFEALRFVLTGDGSGAPYDELAGRLATTAGALRVAVHRMRKRYRALLREEIAGTLASSADVDDELRCLLEALGS